MSTQEINITNWTSGKPPCVGLWIASRHGNPFTKRWFDGKQYSVPVSAEDVKAGAAHLAMLPKEFAPDCGRRPIMYRGLDKPSIHGYEYELTPTPQE